MKKYNSNKNIIIALIIVIVVVAVLSMTIAKRNTQTKTNILQSTVNDTIGLVDKVLTAPFRFLHQTTENISDLMNTYEENQQLKSKIDQYDNLVQKNKNQEREIAQLKEELGLGNVMEIPRITKITLNMGVGAAATDKKLLEGAVADMQLIAGQKPVVTLARKSIAGFKIRDGWPIGCKVTLRGDQMYEFLDRLISIAIPRIRDFRGFSSKSFDGRGNYSMGLKEQIVFPEIDFDKIDRIRGLDITITTTARSDDEGRALMRAFGFPFK